VHVHGRIFENRCTQCGFKNLGDVLFEPPPNCPNCTAPLRPGVIWFDEDLERHQAERVERFVDDGKCDVALIIGTTATFDYIVDWALRAIANGGLLIEVNPEKTRLSVVADLSLRKKAGEAVPKFLF
jgi:NAD-dependent deacetylase